MKENATIFQIEFQNHEILYRIVLGLCLCILIKNDCWPDILTGSAFANVFLLCHDNLLYQIRSGNGSKSCLGVR